MMVRRQYRNNGSNFDKRRRTKLSMTISDNDKLLTILHRVPRYLFMEIHNIFRSVMFLIVDKGLELQLFVSYYIIRNK